MTTRRFRLGLGAIALTGVLVAACGADDVGRFDAQVAEVRSAVVDGDQAAALIALDDLALTALAAHNDGELSDAEITEVTELVQSTRVLVAQLTPAPEPPPTTTSTTAAPKDDDKAETDKGKGKEKSKSKKDDEDD